MKTDIRNREDLKKLVHNFYQKLLQDEEFEHIFLKVAKIDVLDHLDLLIDFWESVLFQAGKYKRNLLQIHLDVHMDYQLDKSHFNRWLKIFNETTDSLFEGEKAEYAKERALSLAAIIKMKIDNLNRLRLEINN